MSIQAISFDVDDFDLFHGCYHMAHHMLECDDCRERCKQFPNDERKIFDMLNERLMVPVEVGNYEAMRNAAINWFNVYSIMGFGSETEH